MQRAQKTSQIAHSRDVSQKHGEDKSLVLARMRQPLIVGFPFILRGITAEQGFTAFVEGEPVGERVWLCLTVTNAGAADECIKAQGISSDLNAAA